MPMLDFQCQGCGEIDEQFYHPAESKNAKPLCPNCGQRMDRVHIGAPNVVWSRGLDFYNDKKLEGASEEGHWVTRKRSTTNKDGSPSREYITTRQAQVKYCREERLVDPADAGKQVGNSDGLRHGVRPAGTRVN